MSQSQPVSEFIIEERASIEDALHLIERNAEGTAIIVDAEGALAGVLTDGDVRRYLLRGGSIRDGVAAAMTRKCVSLPVTASEREIMGVVNREIRIVPLIDEARHPVDVASFGRIHRIPIIEPTFAGNEMDYVTECLRSGWISSQGPFVRRFEQEFAKYIEVPHAIAVSNGTVALHLIIATLGIGSGDEVIVPNLTFAASANAVLHAGAIPVLADVDERGWTLDVESVEASISSRTRAIMPVHLYGRPCEMDELRALAKSHGLLLIEDAAEALGATYHDRKVGGLGDAAAFSFFGNKLITTGEGGMVTLADDALAKRARLLRDHGMDPDRRYWHLEVGYNYRLTNLQAAVGTAQLERIESLVAQKRRLATWYRDRLSALSWIQLPLETDDRLHSHWLFTVMVNEDELGLTRDALMHELLMRGIETRPVFHPLDRMPPYRSCRTSPSLRNSHVVSDAGLSLPSSANLDEGAVEFVCHTLQDVSTRRRVRRFARL